MSLPIGVVHSTALTKMQFQGPASYYRCDFGPKFASQVIGRQLANFGVRAKIDVKGSDPEAVHAAYLVHWCT